MPAGIEERDGEEQQNIYLKENSGIFNLNSTFEVFNAQKYIFFWNLLCMEFCRWDCLARQGSLMQPCWESQMAEINGSFCQ